MLPLARYPVFDTPAAAESERPDGGGLNVRWLAPGPALVLAVAAAALAYEPNAPAAMTKTALLLLVGLAGLALTAARLLDRKTQQLPAAAGAWLAFCGWCLASVLWSEHGRLELSQLWIGAAAVALSATVLSRRQARWAASWCAVLVGGISAAVCLTQLAMGARGLGVHGLHGNPNWLGMVLATCLPLQVGLAEQLKRARQRLWLVAAGTSALSLPALYVASSRVAWLALFVAALVFARARWRWLLLAPAAALAALAGSVAGLAPAWAGRTWVWRISLDVALRAQPFGLGVGDFPWAFLDAQGLRLARLDETEAALRFVNATTAHEDWIEVTAHAGIPALIALGAAFTIAVVDLRRWWRAGSACVLVVALCAIGDAPLHQVGVTAPLMLVFAATRPWPRRRARQLGHLGCLIATIALLPAATRSWLSSRLLSHARTASVPARMALLNEAAQLDTRSGEAALLLGLARLELGDAAGALTELERSRTRLPNLGTDVAMGNAQLMRNDQAAAIRAYRRALGRHPGYFRAHANLTEALRLAGRLDEAERHLLIAQRLQPGHPKLARIAERLRQSRIDAEVDR